MASKHLIQSYMNFLKNLSFKLSKNLVDLSTSFVKIFKTQCLYIIKSIHIYFVKNDDF